MKFKNKMVLITINIIVNLYINKIMKKRIFINCKKILHRLSFCVTYVKKYLKNIK